MNATPKISLIICTRNRAASIHRCLDAILKIESVDHFELILVNNASTDHTATLLQKFVDSCALPVVVVNEPIPGLSRARNAGIAAASGDLMAFSDDDCYLAPDYLTALGSSFENNKVGFVGGRVLLFDPTDLPITIQTSEQPAQFLPQQYMPPSGAIHGANFAFRREVFNRIGLFDINLGAGTPCMGAEDTDLLQRALMAGFQGLYSPAPLVFHHHGRRTADDEKTILRAYALARGAYFLKGLINPLTRGLYVWPVLKRGGGHLAYCRYMDLFQELKGALFYWRQHRLNHI